MYEAVGQCFLFFGLMSIAAAYLAVRLFKASPTLGKIAGGVIIRTIRK